LPEGTFPPPAAKEAAAEEEEEAPRAAASEAAAEADVDNAGEPPLRSTRDIIADVALEPKKPKGKPTALYKSLDTYKQRGREAREARREAEVARAVEEEKNETFEPRISSYSKSIARDERESLANRALSIHLTKDAKNYRVAKAIEAEEDAACDFDRGVEPLREDELDEMNERFELLEERRLARIELTRAEREAEETEDLTPFRARPSPFKTTTSGGRGRGRTTNDDDGDDDDGDGQVNLEDRMNAIDLSYDGESGTPSSAKAAARASTSFTASAAKSFHMEASLRSEKRAAERSALEAERAALRKSKGISSKSNAANVRRAKVLLDACTRLVAATVTNCTGALQIPNANIGPALRALGFLGETGVRLLPIRPRSRCERRSLRTFPVVTLHPHFPFNV
jgi:hypothetical protein